MCFWLTWPFRTLLREMLLAEKTGREIFVRFSHNQPNFLREPIAQPGYAEWFLMYLQPASSDSSVNVVCGNDRSHGLLVSGNPATEAQACQAVNVSAQFSFEILIALQAIFCIR